MDEQEHSSQSHKNRTMEEQNFFAKLMFYNETIELLELRRTFEHAQSQNHQQILTLEDINKLPPSQDNLKENAEFLYSNIEDRLCEEKIQLSFLMGLLWGIYKYELMRCFILFCISMVFDFGRFYAFRALLENVSHYQQAQGKASTYLLGGIFLGTILLFFQFQYHSSHELQKLGNKLKNTLRLSLQRKILSLKKHEIDSSKVMSIVEELQDIVEMNLPHIYKFFTFLIFVIPIILTVGKEIAICALLMIVLEIILIVMQYYSSKQNSKNMLKMNSIKDVKLSLIQQAIQHIKTIKMNVWENLFHQKIKKIREKESQKNVDFAIGRAIAIGMIYSTSYIIIFLVLFFTFLMDNSALNTAMIYSVYYLSKRLHTNIIRGQKATFSIFQIKIFNIPGNRVDQSQNFLDEGQISFKDYSIYKNQSELTQTILSDINLHVQKGEFVGIVGKVGSGKSSILNSLLGQFTNTKGCLRYNGTLAVIQQKATIFSTTIKENILLGRQYDHERYQKCLRVSCLEEDLGQLSLGDQTVAGEKGGMLSGGQKIRICLARALYEEMNIYVFDDILTALDKKVSLDVMHNLEKTIVKKSTFLLITHSINALQKCDKIVLLSEGNIQNIFLKSQFEQFEQVYRETIDANNEDTLQKPQQKNISQIFQSDKDNQRQLEQEFDEFYQPNQEKVEEQLKNPRGSFVKAFVHYFFYHPTGKRIFIVSVLLFIISEIFGVAFIKEMQKFDHLKINPQKLSLFWSILLLLSILVILFDFIKQFALIHSMQNSNDSLHQKSIKNLLKTDCGFYDKEHSGAIITIYSLHINNLDSNIYPQLYECMYSLAYFVVAFVVSSVLNFNMFPVFIVLSIFFVTFNVYFKKIVLQCKNLDLEYRKPISNIFSETINGLNEIKIYKKQQYFYQKMVQKILNSERASMSFYRTLRAYCILSYYLLMAAMAAGTFLILLSLRNDNNHTIGAKLIFLIQSLCRFTFFTLYQIVLDSKMRSFGKILQKVDLESEIYHNHNSDGQLMEQLGPTFSQTQSNLSLKFQNLSLKYPKKDTLALKQLNFSITKGQHIGIIGRTGSGKSSIVQVLFRLIQPLKGSVYQIADVDAIGLGLIQLRNIFAIIPQKPFIFSGTLRENIDPFGLFKDEQIELNLQKVGLLEKLYNFPQKLNTLYHRSLQLLSTGQEQLFCIARVLLRKTPIVVLDQATSQVDEYSNTKIINIVQQCLRKDRILIEIAHKIQNIQECSRIFVIKMGRKVQEGNFRELGGSGSQFFGLLQKENQENNKKRN